MLMNMLHRPRADDGANGRPGPLSNFWYRPVGVQTASGVRVGPDTVMTGQSALVYTCVTIMAEALSVLPMKVYQRKDDGSRKLAPTHPVYRLLHDAPNSYMTPSGFSQLTVMCLMLWGNFYAFQDVDMGTGNIKALLPLHPSTVRPVLLENGRVNYEVWDSQKRQKLIIPQEFIYHVKRGISMDNGLTGLSCIAAMRNAIGDSVAANEHGSRFFRNGAVPSLVITHPESLNDEAREGLRLEWEETHGGENGGGTAILDEGVKVEKLGMSNDDAQWIDSQKLSREVIAAGLRIPLFLLNAIESGASYASIEQQNQGFLTYSLLPIMTTIEEAATKDLISAPQTYYAEYDADVYNRVDLSKRTTAYSASWWLTGNEIREMENLPKIEDPFMDKVQVPLNRGNPGGASQTPNNSNNSPDASKPAPALKEGA